MLVAHATRFTITITVRSLVDCPTLVVQLLGEEERVRLRGYAKMAQPVPSSQIETSVVYLQES
jgi:hypothetical protein